MIALIPVIGPILSKVLCVPVNLLLTQPADVVVNTVKSATTWLIGC